MIQNEISVYGSTGFIGSRFVKMNKDRCVSIDRNKNKPKSKDILYFISTTHNYNIFDKPTLDIETNLTKMVDVLESCRLNYHEDTVFNFVSSWFVYGMNCSLDTKESDYCDPRGFYSITKRAAEQMLMCYCKTYGMKYRILRMTNIIGEGDKNISLKKNAIQHMMNLMKVGSPVHLYDKGTNIRDFMYVDDACRAIKLCIDQSPVDEVINISNREPRKIGEIIHYAHSKMSSTSNITNIDAPNFHKIVQVKNVCLNNDKLLSYGYKPMISTFEAIDIILDSMKG
jgi:nucleoside-diphosphate-sugar epimerase